MLSVNSVSKSYNLKTILDQVSFGLNSGERVGLVGPNGCGKTTLLSILVGEEPPDNGGVHCIPSSTRVGYLPQALPYHPDDTLQGFIHRMEGDLPALGTHLESLANHLASNTKDCALQREYDAVLERIAAASESQGRATGILKVLGLQDVPSDLPVAKFSGGQKTRLALAGVLLSNPQILLLDEPTNHLDLPMLTWLEEWLLGFRGAVLVVSHDRVFLDHVVTRILELDEFTHRLHSWDGNYSAYVEQKETEHEKQRQAYIDQQQKISQMRQDIIRTKAQAARTEWEASSISRGGPDYKQKGFKDYQQHIAKKVAAKAKSRERKLERYLESEERVEKPRLVWEMKLNFTGTPESGKDVIVFEHADIGYPNLSLVKNFHYVLRFEQRVALIGPNGCGKTTLLKTAMGELPSLKGVVRLGANVRVGYMDQEQTGLERDLDALETIQNAGIANETSARSYLSLFLFKKDDVFTKVHDMSYGERARLMLARLVAQGCNLLLLDEPVNHLDISSRVRFEEALLQFKGTLLAVVHDRYFIRQVATEVWEVKDGNIEVREIL
jgi:ATP-binding cassette, subfamily F, member 3